MYSEDDSSVCPMFVVKYNVSHARDTVTRKYKRSSFVRSYRIHGNPAVWLHEGNPVDMLTINTRTEMSGTGHRYIGDSTTAALHIDNVRLEDDGMWECTLEHDQEEFLLGRPIKLVVLGKFYSDRIHFLLSSTLLRLLFIVDSYGETNGYIDEIDRCSDLLYDEFV